ncbi:Beta-hexosaminidase [Chitinophaga sp. MM2321]
MVMLIICQYTIAQQACPVIPLPDQYSKVEHEFVIGNHTALVVKDASLRPIAVYLQQELQRRYQIHVNILSKSRGPAIVLQRSKPGTNADAYTLTMNKEGVLVSARHNEGIFNGIITLLQLTTGSTVNNASLAVACWNITDAPRYHWRGLMLDESRFFYGKEKVKSILDWMAFYKLNRFHWHLTDAPGWRLEIKKYPLLTTVGGIGNFKNPNAPAAYYTQDDIKEIVAYAQERFITIIPEIDMPGHASAANRAYPAFNGGGTEKYPDFTFNPGREGTYQYLTDILKETDALFPSQLIHLGGDEVSSGNAAWDADSGIARLMQTHKLTSRKQVEDYFIQRMADTVLKMNNKVMAWDEIATATLPANKTIVCWWRMEKPETLEMSLQKGYSVILCPRLPFYLDFVQDSSHKIGRRWKNGEFNELKSVYTFSSEQLPATHGKDSLILGIQGCLWTETIPDGRRLDFMLYPRISALAEAAWTQPAKRDFDKFTARLKPQMKLFEQAGLYYFDFFSPRKHVETGDASDEKHYID